MNRQNRIALACLFLLGATLGCQAATPEPSSTFQPNATPTDEGFIPGDPTATPPGEDIVDPNYLQGKAAYEAKDYFLPGQL